MDDRDRNFLAQLATVTESQPYDPEGPLNAPDWDSLVVLSVIALIDETYDVVVPAKALTAVQTVPELFALLRSVQE
jgi:acyl carrier protein